MQKTEKKLSMVSGSPAKSLIAFTIPLILGNLFQQFYNLIDSEKARSRRWAERAFR